MMAIYPLTSGQEAAHILAHTVLGAAVAAAGGNNALTAGLSAGGAEAAAPILSSFLYGKDAKDLTADQKSTISSIVGLAGSAVGATTGDIVSTVQSGQVAQNAVEDNLYAILTADRKKYDAKKNTEYFNALRNCTHIQCINMVLTNNAEDAMKNAPQILVLNGTTYKEGQIIGSGLQYLVVNENGVLKAKLLPLNYQVINSIKELETGQSIAQGGALAAPLANLIKGLHDSKTGTSLLTNQQLDMVDRAFAALDAVGSFGMITGAFVPKGVKTTGNSKTENITSNKSSNLKNAEELAKLANIKEPNPRHNGATVTPKTTAKENNTVVSNSVNMKQDTQIIKNGEATNLGRDPKTGDTLHSLSNGRVYAEKSNGQIYPYSGEGVYQLDRGSYRALGIYNKYGDTQAAKEALNLNRINPESQTMGYKVWKEINK